MTKPRALTQQEKDRMLAEGYSQEQVDSFKVVIIGKVDEVDDNNCLTSAFKKDKYGNIIIDGEAHVYCSDCKFFHYNEDGAECSKENDCYFYDWEDSRPYSLRKCWASKFTEG